MGSGTALLLVVVVPMSATRYVPHEYLSDDISYEKGPGLAGGREARTILDFFPVTRTSPFPASRQPLYLRGCSGPLLSKPRRPGFLTNPGSTGGPRESCSAASEPVIWFSNPQAGRSVGARRRQLCAAPPCPNVVHTERETHTQTHALCDTVLKLLTAVVRYHLHTVHPFKVGKPWFLVCLHSCAIILII